MTNVYVFQNGFAREAESMYGWLNHYNFTPSWAPVTDGTSTIQLPDHEVPGLRLMQKTYPARFGNPPTENPRGVGD